jgi:HK97 family phage prohead protease
MADAPKATCFNCNGKKPKGTRCPKCGSTREKVEAKGEELILLDQIDPAPFVEATKFLASCRRLGIGPNDVLTLPSPEVLWHETQAARAARTFRLPGDGKPGEVVTKFVGGVEKRAALPSSGADARRRYRITISDGGEDRDGDRVDPGGWKLDSFRANPVLLLHHDPRRPVGRVEGVTVEGGKLVGTATLPPPGVLADADEAAALLDADVLSAVSPGFRIAESTANQHRGRDITAAELLEVSLVSLPTNPRALVR